jgi:hypothetical protein
MKRVLLFFLFVLPAFGQNANTPDPNPFERALTLMRTEPVTHYRSPTAADRMNWFVESTVSPSRLFIVGPNQLGVGHVARCAVGIWDTLGRRRSER